MSATGDLMVLDSAGLWFRAFHSVPEKITGPDGAPVNALRGFCDMTAALITQHEPTGLVAALDVDWRPGWRVDLLPSYKTHRVADDGAEDAPDTLGPQVELIRELLSALGVAVAGAPDSEADDVIAEFAADDRDTLVVTGDRDLLQLASSTTRVAYIGAGMKKQVVYTPESVAEKFDLPVGDDVAAGAVIYADYAVLVGDASDGLPGVAGIGAKTAAKLLREYRGLDGLVAAAHDDSSALPARQRAAIRDASGYLRSARKVVTLGRRPIRLDVTGSRDGRRGATDAAAVDRLMEATGQARSIGRLAEALASLDSV